jgi:serine protease Do
LSVRRGAILLLASLAGAAPVVAQPALAAPEATSDDATSARVESALAAVYPALVNITAVSRQFSDGRAVRFPTAGSGVIVSAQGHVLTNYHVAGETTRIRCTLTSGEVLDADVVAHDPLTDLSVLRLRPAAGATALPPLSPARLDEEVELSVGDPVLAMGNPFALSSSVTLGIVSNPKRVFTDFAGSEMSEMELGAGETTGLFTQWIQHDALILPGNSGGPLVDLDGRVVGINELGGGGIGFAIPARVAGNVLRHAIADGEVRRGDLGFLVLPVAKTGRTKGALVSAVWPGSPAVKAGLKPGDIVLRLAGEPVAVLFFEQVPDLYRRIADLPIGSDVELAVERAGAPLALRATVTELEPARGEERELRRLGISAQEITGPMALARELRVRDGLLVTGIRPGQPAAGARPQINPGDVVVAVDDAPVRSLVELERALAAAGPELLIELWRGDERLLSIARLPDERNGRSGGELPKAWLGVRTQVVTAELAEAIGLPGTSGFRITEVYPFTAAASAGLEVGDLVLAIDGEPLEASRPQDAEELRRIVEERPIGELARFGLLRAGAPVEVAVRLEAQPEGADQARRSRQEEFEFAVRDLLFLDRVEENWSLDQRGVVVTDVVSGGWAHMAGLRTRDLIVRIDSTPITDVPSFEAALAQTLIERPAVVTFFLRRGARTHFVFLEPEWAEVDPEPEGSR